MLYWLARALIRFVARVALRWQVEGVDQVPAHGPVLLAINHVSALDPLLAGSAVNRRVHFMAKAELFRQPLLGPLVRRLGAFPVRRGEADRQALRQAIALLEAGEVVGIFPEGTRSADGELQPPQTGIAYLARRTGAAVVPVAIRGSEAILPKGARWPRPARVQVLIGAPLFPDQSRKEEAAAEMGRDQLRAFAEEVMRRIGELLGKAKASGGTA